MIDTKQSIILITGGAGFIGANLCEYFLNKNHKVICLDNLATGHYSNIELFLENRNFTFINGDIRNIHDCNFAVRNVDYVLHQAALGSVPRSIKDPITTNDVNVSGFLNMLIASRDAGVKRFIYAASSSTYGDSTDLPKIENVIGKPLSPYAVTKYINELYADVFFKNFGIETIGLRYFNVFGPKQDPNGEYAAVIPKFIQQLIRHQSPVINGDGNYSRDFTYIDNVLQLNDLAMFTNNPKAINTVYNTAFGARNTLNELINLLKQILSQYDPEIATIDIIYGQSRIGDIPHSLANIDKARELLNYNPKYSLEDGLKKSINWYFEKLKIK